MQDKELQGLYTSYLVSMQTAGGVVNHSYTVDYAEFFEVIKQHAELLDSTNAHTADSFQGRAQILRNNFRVPR